jgi:aminopeptidase N
MVDGTVNQPLKWLRKKVHMKLCIIAISIFMISFTGIADSAEVLPVYNLSVSFDLEHNLLKGDARITFPDDGERNISVGELNVISLKFNERQLEPVPKEGILTIRGQGLLEIVYEGAFKGEGEETGIEDLENVGVISKNIVSGRGISLMSNWYPSPGDMSLWSLQAIIPKGFKAISEAEEINITDNDQGTAYSFHFPYPVRQMHLVAGPYTEQCESHQGIEICSYFFPEDASLVGKYLDYAKKYLSLYGELLGPYPYKRFCIAENILPTGYSMPTFTLLGQAVVKLPFIPETSFGHEILHQWFGNYVYGDPKSGNWLEGITSYLSDHLYEGQKGTGWQHRKKILIDYQSYVTPSKEAPLRDFKERTDFPSAAAVYAKGAMVFHMLNNLVGEKIFLSALQELIGEKKFSEASWTDIEGAFEKATGENLEWFFSQWLERKDVPSLYIRDARVVVFNGVPTISFEVLQKGEPYKLSLPVKVVTEKGEIKDMLQIEKAKQEFRIPVDGKALSIIFDGDYDLMRELTDKEFPPVLARLFGDEEKLLVFPEKEKEKYSGLIQIFSKEGFAVREEQEVKDEDIRNSSLLILGYESPVLKRLFGQVRKPETGFTLVVKHNLLNEKKVIAYADADSKEEIDPAAAKLFRYGEYSLLRFSGGENVEKKTDDSERGITVSLYQPVRGLNPKTLINFNEILNTVIDKPIIFVGERHANYEDHKVQLEIIMDLFQRQKKFAIGMEMFQRPFQKALDDYLSGAIGEREFLKASEYFKRWKYDYNLYREIIEFARAKGIPVVALNLKEEIVRKVAEGGLDALTPEEKKEIPADMDMADDDYRERVNRAFQFHERSPVKNFEYFYQSQILWDETMAHSIAQFLNDHPDFQMVVLAGEQHIIFNSGIPKRTFRLTGKDYATLINGIEEVDADVGNFVLFPEPLTLPVSPRLGVLLQEDEGKLRVKDLLPGSVAAHAGIKKDDAVISVDDWKIESIEDVKIALFDKKIGETVIVKVLRKRFLRRDKEIEFEVTL